MKILFAGHTIPPSGETGVSMGISRYAYSLTHELVKMGNDVTMLVRKYNNPKEEWIEQVSAPKVSWVAYPFFLFPKVRNRKADVYHADYVSSGAPLLLAGKRPTVVSIHDVIPFEQKPSELKTAKDKIGNAWYKLFFKMIKSADAVVLATEYARQEAIRLTNIPEEKLFAVHYGIDTDRFKPKRGKSGKNIRIGYLGGLDGRKNVGLLVEAFKKASESMGNIELHIAGGGENLEKFRAMKIPRAKFYGALPYEKASDFYASLDVFVFPTLSEGFGLPPLEAMACGVPVVTSNKSTMPEIVGDAGVTADANVDAMTEAICSVAASGSKRKKMREKGFKRVKKFSWKACAQNTMKVYEEVMK